MFFGELFTDLSKAFDFISQDLFNVKLNATGLTITVLKLILDYVLNQKQRTKC